MLKKRILVVKLIGGIKKGRPSDEDIAGVINFFIEITNKKDGYIKASQIN